MLRRDPVSSLLRAWRCWQPSLSSLAPRRPAALPQCAADPGPVREAMKALAASLPAPAALRVAAAIASRRDVAGLWHLRVALMQALAGAHGEADARRRIADLDAVFLRVWPAAPVTHQG
jgi:hypothetical protein